jgi:hypothetical protein
LTRVEWLVLKELKNPAQIQDFLNSLPFNFEKRGETHYSPRNVLRHKTANCFEGALLAALALWICGKKPLILDLKTVRPDMDHVVALFKEENPPAGGWGAISKTNHGVLRFREPVYRSVRELTMSYFHEYFLPNGKKTLRSFSKPFDLSKIGVEWINREDSLADVAHRLDHTPHTKILSPKQIKNLRRADPVEIKAGEITEYPR